MEIWQGILPVLGLGGESELAMVGTSKILTVSYGTFSCTLEGFDDPFATMRSIAEYFRDLAAEDRYFGAEPPTPDVGHLHALAQKSSPKPIAAQVQENGLHLTQTQDDAQADADATQSDRAAAPVDTSPEPDPAQPAQGSDEAAPPARQAAAPAAASVPSVPVSAPPAPAAASPVASVDPADTASAPDLLGGDPKEPMDEDHALLLDGIDEDDIPELEDDGYDEDLDDEDVNLFDADAVLEDDAPKPAYDPRAAIAAKLEAARQTVAAAETTEAKRLRTPQVSEDDLQQAAGIAPNRSMKRPDAFRDDLESLNAGQSDLSDEDEADLIAELEALDREQDESAPKAKEGRAILESDLIEREEAALDRLLAKTNSKLNDDDVEQKRAALSHMKAAVAAKMADGSEPVDHETDRKDPDSAYRDDLAKAVQPKPKPAPLVLVADRDAKPAQPAEAKPSTVRPRRVDTKANAPARQDTDAGFAAYAEQVGATELTDLLEAAAAYLNTVEGADSFTRPEVMHMVLRQERGKDFTREDSLRSFDALLRKGMIHKVGLGKFAIHEDSRYVS